MTDWNEKLALLQYGLAATALGLDPEGVDARMLKAGTTPEAVKELRARFDQAWSWIEAAPDRAPLPALNADKSPKVDASAALELTHPISAARLKVEVPTPERLRTALGAVLDEIATRFAGDPRRQALYLWGCLPTRLAELEPGFGPDWYRFPIDPRSPQHSAWSQISLAAAIALATPDPVLLTFELSLGDPALVRRALDMHTAGSLQAQLSWVAAQSLIEELGPCCILQPSLLLQPLVDRWLKKEGVATGAAATEPEEGLGFPSSFLAIVPSSRVEELGGKCLESAKAAWRELAKPVQALLAGKAAAAEIVKQWDQQIEASLSANWTAVPIEDDSTGAGALLPSRDISQFEKIVKQRREASGMDQAGKGVFFGLWCDAARAASEARGFGSPFPSEEPLPFCTVCGEHAAVGGASLWSEFAKGQEHRVLLQGEELLCAPCSVKRFGPTTGSLPWTALSEPEAQSKGTAVLVVSGDSPSALARGGLESKEGATLRSTLHSEVPAQLLKARGRWRDVLDSPVLGGPCRGAALAEAWSAFAFGSARHILSEAKAQVLALSGQEIVATVPVAEAFGIARKLRDAYREPFAVISAEGAKKRVLHPGRAATLSCVLALSPNPAATPSLVRRAHQLLQGTAFETYGRNALVFLVRTNQGREHLLVGRWEEVGESLEVAIGLLRSSPEPSRVVSAIAELGVALTNTDLDKSKSESRLGLLKKVVTRHLPEVSDLEQAGRAFLTLIDRNAAAGLDPEGQHGMDGIYAAGFLAEGVR